LGFRLFGDLNYLPDYMNGFKCNITGATSTVPVAAPKVARRCGVDSANGKWHAAPGNCTYGAKQPLYWFQAERNNVRPSLLQLGSK
jgi:hypothetical protein